MKIEHPLAPLAYSGLTDIKPSLVPPNLPDYAGSRIADNIWERNRTGKPSRTKSQKE